MQVNGLYGHKRRNDARSLGMFLGFVAAVEVIALGFLAPAVLMIGLTSQISGKASIWPTVGLYLLGGLCFGAIWFFHHLWRHVREAREIAGFDFVERRDERRLYDLLEQTAIANGLPCPRAAILETPALNAFVCGLTARGAVVVVTRGLIDQLDDDELAAVLAHELAHVRLGDMRLMACAQSGLAAILSIESRIAPRLGKRAILLVLAPMQLIMLLAMKATGAIGRMLAYLSQIMISRSREFVADATAVEITKNPGALISALQKIAGRSGIHDLDPAISAMMIDGPAQGATITHPAIGERIAALRAHAGALIDLAAPRRDTRERPAGTFGARAASATPGAFGRRAATGPADGLAAARAVLGAAARGKRGEPPPSQWREFMNYSPRKKLATIGGVIVAYAAMVHLSPYLPGMGGQPTFSSAARPVVAEPLADAASQRPRKPAASRIRPQAPPCPGPACDLRMRGTTTH